MPGRDRPRFDRVESITAEKELRIASYNIHKGMSFFNRRVVLHDVRERLRGIDADIVFLQEVQGQHLRRARRHGNWPEEPQHEVLAGEHWQGMAYGRNAIYEQGHHGNAILSHYPILKSENIDISAHVFESRGMLHCEIDVPGLEQPLHAICLHLALNEAGRRKQMELLAERIRAVVPDAASLIIAGDFNDWRRRSCGYLDRELGLREVFDLAYGKTARSFPAVLPMLSLDRIYVRGFGVAAARVLHGALWRRLSDHAALTAQLRPL